MDNLTINDFSSAKQIAMLNTRKTIMGVYLILHIDEPKPHGKADKKMAFLS